MFGFKKKEIEAASFAASGENAIANKDVEGLSQGQIVLKRFFRHKAAVISLIFLTGIITLVFSAVNSNIGPIKIFY